MTDTPTDAERKVNNDEVICPNCVHQFGAIPVNVQRELFALRAEIERLRGVDLQERIIIADQSKEIERLRAELEEANITIRALVGAAPPNKEKP
jgi:hypothetical protein